MLWKIKKKRRIWKKKRTDTHFLQYEKLTQTKQQKQTFFTGRWVMMAISGSRKIRIVYPPRIYFLSRIGKWKTLIFFFEQINHTDCWISVGLVRFFYNRRPYVDLQEVIGKNRIVVKLLGMKKRHGSTQPRSRILIFRPCFFNDGPPEEGGLRYCIILLLLYWFDSKRTNFEQKRYSSYLKIFN